MKGHTLLTQVIKEKLDNNKLVILDGAMGSELEKKGAQMGVEGLEES